MQIARTLHVEAPVEKVWSILADDYATIGDWARAVEQSAANPDVAPLPGAEVGGRVCTANIGEVTETITTFDPKHHVLAYGAKANAMPFFVRGLTGRWTLEAAKGGTRVDLGFEADLMPPFGTLMGWAMKRQLRRPSMRPSKTSSSGPRRANCTLTRPRPLRPNSRNFLQ